MKHTKYVYQSYGIFRIEIAGSPPANMLVRSLKLEGMYVLLNMVKTEGIYCDAFCDRFPP